MFEILIIMFAGMALGLIVKNQKTILAFTERLTMVAIYLLLFCLVNLLLVMIRLYLILLI